MGKTQPKLEKEVNFPAMEKTQANFPAMEKTQPILDWLDSSAGQLWHDNTFHYVYHGDGLFAQLKEEVTSFNSTKQSRWMPGAKFGVINGVAIQIDAVTDEDVQRSHP